MRNDMPVLLIDGYKAGHPGLLQTVFRAGFVHNYQDLQTIRAVVESELHK